MAKKVGRVHLEAKVMKLTSVFIVLLSICHISVQIGCFPVVEVEPPSSDEVKPLICVFVMFYTCERTWVFSPSCRNLIKTCKNKEKTFPVVFFQLCLRVRIIVTTGHLLMSRWMNVPTCLFIYMLVFCVWMSVLTNTASSCTVCVSLIWTSLMSPKASLVAAGVWTRCYRDNNTHNRPNKIELSQFHRCIIRIKLIYNFRIQWQTGQMISDSLLLFGLKVKCVFC